MRRVLHPLLERGRVAGDTALDGMNGLFMIPGPQGLSLTIQASDGWDWQECGLPGEPWEHVSVSTRRRCPTWEEMDFVKRLFWEDEETVIQFHVPRSEHLNLHPNCLHMWRPKTTPIPRPPAATVAPVTVPPLTRA